MKDRVYRIFIPHLRGIELHSDSIKWIGQTVLLLSRLPLKGSDQMLGILVAGLLLMSACW